MRTPTSLRRRHIAVTALVCVGLLVAACTRSANPTTLPPNTPGGIVTDPFFGDDSQNATMAAISTEVSNQLTQTAVAEGGAGGGGEETVIAPPTETPGPNGLPTGAPDVLTATPIPMDTAAPPPPAGGSCPNPYTVQQGDWIYKIARDCGVSASALIAANPGINPNAIKPGQLLNMPAAGATPVPGAPQAQCTGTHTVVSGDTLYRLAFNCGLTVEQLAAANNIVFPYTIFVGQVLTYP
jgi:LysM repeat protein